MSKLIDLICMYNRYIFKFINAFRNGPFGFKKVILKNVFVCVYRNFRPDRKTNN